MGNRSEQTEVLYGDELIDAFEVELRGSGNATPDLYFPPPDREDFVFVVSEILRIQIEWDWHRGDQGSLEKLFTAYPFLSQQSNILAAAAFEEFRLRRLSGEEISPQEYELKYGLANSATSKWLRELGQVEDYTQSQLRELSFSTVPKLKTNSATVNSLNPTLHNESLEFPRVGENLGEFLLLDEIGAGAFSRVFIAKQLTLADRIVVLKVTTVPMGESQRLARLQHTNIMPLFSVHRDRGFFVLCMPFLGVLTLREVIESLRQNKESISNKLTRNGPDNPSDFESLTSLTLRRQLDSFTNQTVIEMVKDSAQLSRVSANSAHESLEDSILLLMRQLADAVAYAHEKGIFHRDIKPANILLGFGGEPLLLDFNLGRTIGNEEREFHRRVGGTLPYMPREQLVAMAFGDDQTAATTDIFSLGVVFYELVSGTLPFPRIRSGESSVHSELQTREENPIDLADRVDNISSGTASIIMKCLASEGVDRYQSGSELREDIDRHLSHLALRFAPNRTLKERFQKFLRRNSRPLQRGTLFVATATIFICLLLFTIFYVTETKRLEAKDRLSNFMQLIHEGEAEYWLAEGGNREQGKALLENAIELFPVASNKNPEPISYMRYLSKEDQARISSLVRYASRLVKLESVPYQELTELEKASEDLKSRRYSSALANIELELERSPGRFSAWLMKGKYHFDCREFSEAESAFRSAEVCTPDVASVHVAKSICRYWQGDYQGALASLSRAESLSPELHSITYNRAIVHERMGETEMGLSVIEKGLQAQPSSLRLWSVKRRLLAATNRTKEAAIALAKIRSLDPKEPEDWIIRGISFLPDEPAKALEDFQRARDYETTELIALQNSAHVQSEILGKSTEAIHSLTAALEIDPNFVPARAGRAVLLARLGNIEEAIQDANQCHNSQATAQTSYQLACVYAICSKKDPELKSEALKHLAHAVKPAYGIDQIASDRDLENIVDDAEFQKIKIGITEIKKQLHQ